MSKKLIFFDIDGTIIDEKGYIPPSTVRAIRSAREQGALCVINTGRPYSHIDPTVKAIGFDAYVCSCGQHLEHRGQVVSHVEFAPELCRQIVELTRQCRLDTVYEAEEGIWFDVTHDAETDSIRTGWEQVVRRGLEADQSVDAPGFCFDKFCAFVRPDSDLPRFLAFIEQYGSVIYREGGMLEIIRRGYSKEYGLKQMIALLGVELADCFAIGDSTNDLPMLRCVPHGIAMGNAPDEVKEEAEYVTAPLHQDGIARVLARYGLIPEKPEFV